jgi:hypothetical protein
LDTGPFGELRVLSLSKNFRRQDEFAASSGEYNPKEFKRKGLISFSMGSDSQVRWESGDPKT